MKKMATVFIALLIVSLMIISFQSNENGLLAEDEDMPLYIGG